MKPQTFQRVFAGIASLAADTSVEIVDRVTVVRPQERHARERV